MTGASASLDRPHDYAAPASVLAPHITALRLTHFRSHAALTLGCVGGAMVLTGANGIGKTNVLEALSMLAPGRGLRGAAFDDMRFERRLDWTVSADIATAQGPVRAGIGWQNGARKLRLDGVNGKLDDIAHILPQLWLTPAMDRLFVDGASGRRKFLDRFAQSLDATLSKALGGYEKAMRERNRLLQEGVPNAASNGWLDGLEEAMALQGVAIAAARLTALDALAVGLAAIPETAFPRAEIALAGSLESGLRRQSALEVEDAFRARLAQARRLDGAAGRTLEGPHRSDLQVIYAAKSMAAADCSTGEQKALLVGLILAQAHSVATQRGNVPILLLDEVAAHLDRHRRCALAEILYALGGQSWITGTDNEAFEGFETVFGPAFAAVNMAAKMTETGAGEASPGSTSS
ncbi:MAG: DNA replication/repair protein RecF [Alphaproteobacteria bacterium]|nr:DNA replication/repair protein RecF [Alphaproteobacteria bacterium]